MDGKQEVRPAGCLLWFTYTPRGLCPDAAPFILDESAMLDLRRSPRAHSGEMKARALGRVLLWIKPRLRI